MDDADRIIEKLGLAAHPEGGWYRQTWVAVGPGRASGTSILFVLKAAERSHWHRVDADEIWHFHAGGPLLLEMSPTAAGPVQAMRLGPDVLAGDAPQGLVPAGWWQAARPLAGWVLVGCTVSPGFQFDGFELAPVGFDIPRP